MPVVELPIQGNGLLVEVEVAVSAPLRALYWRKGRDIPPPIRATFLIDTGADTTMVDEQTMRSLSLQPTSQTRLISATSAGRGEPCNVYGVGLTLFPHHAQPKMWNAIEVLGRPLLNQGTDGLLGRDLLSQLVFTYDGPHRLARVTY